MDLHERLRTARIEAGYATARAAAEAFGWNSNTVSSNENGNRTFGREAAARYARAYHVDLGWLLTGRGGMRRGAGAEIFDIWDRIPERDRSTARRMLEGLAEPKAPKFKGEKD
ncbi:MAG: helix-turn-helix domain-containing protein [Pseudomonadota bacterium]